VAGAVSLPLLWPMLHDYQRRRVLTLLDPMEDPLGAGYHIIQSTIAIGSGGILGKGWLNGTQAQLDFVPERSTDFILAVFGEEFGLVGNVTLVLLYVLIVGRGLMIAANASTVFARLIAGAITPPLTYAFVNGHGERHLPVVGVAADDRYGGIAFGSSSVRHPHDRDAQAAGGELSRAWQALCASLGVRNAPKKPQPEQRRSFLLRRRRPA
jgi:rod shape determining protein RodA